MSKRGYPAPCDECKHRVFTAGGVCGLGHIAHFAVAADAHHNPYANNRHVRYNCEDYSHIDQLRKKE